MQALNNKEIFSIHQKRSAELQDIEDFLLCESFSVQLVASFFRNTRLRLWLRQRHKEKQPADVEELHFFVCRLADFFLRKKNPPFCGAPVNQLSRTANSFLPLSLSLNSLGSTLAFDSFIIILRIRLGYLLEMDCDESWCFVPSNKIIMRPAPFEQCVLVV